MILRSGYPDVAVPSVSLPELIFGDLADDDAGRLAVIDSASGVQYSYGELVTAMERVAAGLALRGIGAGDVAAVVLPNCAEYPVVFHGVLRAGGVVSPMNPLCTPEEIAYQLRDSGARILFTWPGGVESARAAVDGTSVEEIVVVDGPDFMANTAECPQWTSLPDDLAVLPYSSGTTGLPKGVMLTHRNLVANTLQIWPLGRLSSDTRTLAVLPLFHIYGMTGIMNMTLLNRATMVTMPRFDFKDFLGTISAHRVDHVYIAPPIALALAKSPLVDEYDLDCVEVILSAAAPLDAEIAEALARRLDTTVVQGYGLTESSPCTHGIPVDRPEISRGSIGVLMPGVEARVVDPATGEDASAGELWCRGPNIMRGYLNNPSATAATIDGDGFLHTGDVVTVNEDGVFTVIDRLKELIKYKGYQIAPAELEAVLLTHPGIADAAVIGIPDPDAGEIPKAFVTLAIPGIVAEDIQAYVARQVAPYKKIRRVEFVDQIPKSAAGKILRKVLRARES